MNKSVSYKRYRGYERKLTPFTIFLIHGREDNLYRKIQVFIERDLNFKTIVLKDEFNGKTIIEKLQQKIWLDSDCALAVMSADDELKTLEVHARPNVLFEIDYYLGYFNQLFVDDYENENRPVILIKEDRTYTPSDLNGIEVIEYSNSHRNQKEQFIRICEAVEQRLLRLFEQIKNYYK